MQAPDWLNMLAIASSTLGTLVVAVATVVLCRVTHSLYKETKRLADISSQPHVVATVEPSPWAVTWTNFHVQNTGNATAYDIEVVFDPAIDSVKSDQVKNSVAFQRVSALQPGKEFITSLSETRNLFGKSFNVTTSWRRVPRTGPRETNSYVLNFSDYEGMRRLGPADPFVKIADEVAHLREDWRKVALGWSRLRVDAFTHVDRDRDERDYERQQRLEEAEAQAAAEPGEDKPTTGGTG